MSPVIPFVTDKIYQNLVSVSSKKEPSSIHLLDFPIYDEKLENHKIMEDIDTVKDIVNLGRSIRNKKANLKIRQPLKDIKIFFDKLSPNISNYDNQILEELNIKEIFYVEEISEIVSYNVKPNFSNINRDYRDKKSNIISKINLLENDFILKELNTKNYVDIEDEKLTNDYFIIDEIPLENYCCSSNKKISCKH